MFWCKKKQKQEQEHSKNKYTLEEFERTVTVKIYKVTIFAAKNKKYTKTVETGFQFTHSYANLKTGQHGCPHSSDFADTVCFEDVVYTTSLNPLDFACNGHSLVFQTDDGSTEIIPSAQYLHTHITPPLSEKEVKVTLRRLVPIVTAITTEIYP